MKKKLLIASLLSGGLITAALAQGHLQPNQFWGNSGGSAALPFGFTIDSLTSKASPTNSDLLVISDQAASGALKKAVLSSIAAATAVTGIDALTGAFTTSNGITSTGSSIQLTSARRTLPTISLVTTGAHSGGFGGNGSGTYTTPANVLWIEIELVGGGAGGVGGAGAGGAAGASCWNTSGAACSTPVYSAGGGSGVSGGTISGSSTCSVAALAGGNGTGGGSTTASTTSSGGAGGATPLGGAGVGVAGTTGGAAQADTGSGGGGGGVSAVVQNSAGGGGAGATCRVLITSPAATYTYVVGTKTAGGGSGSNIAAGGSGADGRITVIEHYGS